MHKNLNIVIFYIVFVLFNKLKLMQISRGKYFENNRDIV